MTQELLNQAVARATGENVRTIASLGFVPLTLSQSQFETQVEADDDRDPLMVDWDELDLERYLSLCG